jgi:hypothetical protein
LVGYGVQIDDDLRRQIHHEDCSISQSGACGDANYGARGHVGCDGSLFQSIILTHRPRGQWSSGLSLLISAGWIIACKKDAFTGAKVTSSLLVANIVVHFLECESGPTLASTLKCTSIKTVGGATPGLILTTTLHGILGLILPSEEIGLLVLPVTGKIWFELAKTENAAGELCSKESKMTGNIVGLIKPVGTHQTTGKLIFTSPNPEDFDLTHGLGLVEPELDAFSVGVSESTTEEITFTEPTEVS